MTLQIVLELLSTHSLSSRGPEDTCFEFGVFPAILSFPLDYPLSPPKMRFTCEMFHPNSECFCAWAVGPVSPASMGPALVTVEMKTRERGGRAQLCQTSSSLVTRTVCTQGRAGLALAWATHTMDRPVVQGPAGHFLCSGLASL